MKYIIDCSSNYNTNINNKNHEDNIQHPNTLPRLHGDKPIRGHLRQEGV